DSFILTVTQRPSFGFATAIVSRFVINDINVESNESHDIGRSTRANVSTQPEILFIDVWWFVNSFQRFIVLTVKPCRGLTTPYVPLPMMETSLAFTQL
ncbi:hypothetical protein PFISCL1PPCAC_7195, partial [Pristionchus fissidentatus]